MPSATSTLSSVAATPALIVTDNMIRSSVLPPAVLCVVSPGATLTYVVEVTGDATATPFYAAATGNWLPLDPTMSGLTASANATLTASITGIRARITAYTSGTLTFQVVWGSPIAFGAHA